ncbi:hypothetical protein WR25_11027 [Diploscapter pachys]|uniref:VPS9 domain-containing protein n=1 Tax=Diploscapter pachys TaxID=2018661 RepID=A0A2A2K2V5_9BILA|nr:hypothetical protein WR25_11027 [Diploscapter pachys]
MVDPDPFPYECLRSFTESGQERVLNCDDLLPAFLYVVIRARLRRLGAEITYLDEFTRGYRGLGQADMMFTLLHSCYVQICREKSLV